MILIGIDPGLARVGYGLLSKNGNDTRHLTHGCITTRATDEHSTGARLDKIYRELQEIIREYRPEQAAVEKLFFSKNITSAMAVAEVRGIILLLCEQEGIGVTEYTPNQVKQAITGSGKADKAQMQDMIRRLLHLEEIPRPDDAADGLSIALCHANTVRGSR